VTTPTALLFALVLLLAGASGAAVLARLFRGDDADPGANADAVVSFALPVGLILAAIPGWMVSSFIYTPISGVAIPMAILALVAGLLWGGADLPAVLPRARARLVPLAIFFGVFLFFLWLRWANFAEIRQTEKPMDFAVLSGLMTTARLPFPDPWLSGERFPYYHFGTYLFALPARAARLPSEYAYNLIAALLPALAALAGFGAIRARRGGTKLAVFGALLLIAGGTFDGARQYLSGRHLDDIDWWLSERRVDNPNTITEWPLFTFRLGDLHPHAMTFPFLVTLLGLAGRIARVGGTVLDGLLLAAVVSANPWDLPASLLILGAGNLAEREFRPAFIRSLASLLPAAFFLVPFALSPRPEFNGLTFWQEGTGAGDAFLHFGVLAVIPALAFGIALLRSQTRADEALVAACAFPAFSLALLVVSKKPVFSLAAGFAAGVLWLLLRETNPLEPAPPVGAVRAGLLLAASGAVLAAVPDVVLVSDSYGVRMHRMNTVFKCFMGAWPLLALGGALLLPLALSTRHARAFIRVAIGAALLGALAHPLSAIAFRWNWKGAVDGLDGLRWMTRPQSNGAEGSMSFAGDREAISWLRAHAVEGAVLAEATGGAYTDYGRIGAATGLPIVLGWENHENLWRGGPSIAETSARSRDLKLIYTAEPPNVFSLLHQYKIRYVVVGALERRDFGPNAFPMRANFRRAFTSGDTTVYEILK
jgi:YYY domain-containing protein